MIKIIVAQAMSTIKFICTFLPNLHKVFSVLKKKLHGLMPIHWMQLTISFQEGFVYYQTAINPLKQ